MRLARRISKTAVVSGVCDGFIGNRMVEQYLRQAFFLLDEGASPVQVDRALKCSVQFHSPGIAQIGIGADRARHQPHFP